MPNAARIDTLARPPELLVPWYRVGVMWLFVGGLGAVVIGSFMLMATAWRNMDTLEPQAPLHDGARVAVPNASFGAPPDRPPNTPLSPAMQARNHAATPRP